MRAWKLFLLLSLIAIVPACGPSRKSVFPVKGRVVDSAGKPVAGATVLFHPSVPDPEDPTIPSAHVDESGAFSLTTYVEGDGAPAGDYRVTVLLVPGKRHPLDLPVPDLLKGRYADPATSQILFTVEKKDLNEVPDIHVELTKDNPNAKPHR